MVITPRGYGSVSGRPSPRTPTSVTPGQLSVAPVPSATAATQTPGSVFTSRLAVVITGFSVSFTVTVKVLVCALPWASITVEVTVVVPTGKVDPEAGVLITLPVSYTHLRA